MLLAVRTLCPRPICVDANPSCSSHVHNLVLFFSKVILLERQSHKKRGETPRRDPFYLPVHSLTGHSDWAWYRLETGPRRSIRISPSVLSSAALSCALAGSWIGREAAGTQTDTYVGCQCSSYWLNSQTLQQHPPPFFYFLLLTTNSRALFLFDHQFNF